VYEQPPARQRGEEEWIAAWIWPARWQENGWNLQQDHRRVGPSRLNATTRLGDNGRVAPALADSVLALPRAEKHLWPS
jgi:hypothetical protein